MREPLPKIAICGHGRSGKDEAARYLARRTPLRFAKSTSEVIAPYAAAKLGRPVDVAFAERHQNRVFWFNVGNELRAEDPAFLVRECLKAGEIVVGMRNRSEVVAVRAERLVDLVVWIDRDVPADPTQEFGVELCDLVVPNRGTLEEFHGRLEALARWAGLLKESR
jgi:hypothetical protein